MVCGAMLAWLSDACAQSATPVSRCRFEPVGEGLVRTVIDGRSIVLADGREVRLDAIEIPFMPAGGTRPPGERRPGSAVGPCDAGGRQENRTTPTGTEIDRPVWPSAGVRVSRSRSRRPVGRARDAGGRLRPGRRPGRRPGVRRRTAGAGTRRPRRQAWPVGRTVLCHRRGRERGRAFGRPRPFHAGGRQGVVGPRERRHDICEFRAAVVAGAHGYDLETQ